jgi:hypothetical protein
LQGSALKFDCCRRIIAAEEEVDSMMMWLFEKEAILKIILIVCKFLLHQVININAREAKKMCRKGRGKVREEASAA